MAPPSAEEMLVCLFANLCNKASGGGKGAQL